MTATNVSSRTEILLQLMSEENFLGLHLQIWRKRTKDHCCHAIDTLIGNLGTANPERAKKSVSIRFFVNLNGDAGAHGIGGVADHDIARL